MATNIDTDLIVSEYGQLYQKRGQGIDRIRRAYMTPATTVEKYATHINTEDDVYEMANDIFEDIIQPYRTQFEPTGGIVFVPNKIVLDHIKVDAQFSPHSIYHSWLQFLANDQNKIEAWPITKYFVEVYLKNKIDEDREKKAIYKGVRNDAGTTPQTCMDGIKKKLIDGVANTDNPINVVPGIQELTEANVFDQIEDFDRGIGDLYDDVNIIIFVAPKWVRAMKTAKRSAGYYFISSPDQIDENVDFTKHVVCALPSMKGTNDIFATTKDNLIWLTNRRKFDFDIQKAGRLINVLVDWKEGVGFGCNALVWTTPATINQTPATPPEPTAVMTGAATEVTTSSMTLNGSINVNDEEVQECGFYHSADAYQLELQQNEVANTATKEQVTGTPNDGNFSKSTAVVAYYMAYSIVDGVTYYGRINQNVITPATPVAVTTEAATDITTTSMTLNGSVNVDDEDVTECGFYHSTDAFQLVQRQNGDTSTATKEQVTGTPTSGEFSKSTAVVAYFMAYTVVDSVTYYGRIIHNA